MTERTTTKKKIVGIKNIVTKKKKTELPTKKNEVATKKNDIYHYLIAFQYSYNDIRNNTMFFSSKKNSFTIKDIYELMFEMHQSHVKDSKYTDYYLQMRERLYDAIPLDRKIEISDLPFYCKGVEIKQIIFNNL